MSYLPELRASLVGAAERRHAAAVSAPAAAPPRRPSRGWLGPAAAAAVAVAVVALAIVLVGHGRSGGGPATGHAAPLAWLKAPPPPSEPNFSAGQWALIKRARSAAAARDRACWPFRPFPATTRALPSARLTSILGVLRRPATAADRFPLQFLRHAFPYEVYVRAIRRASSEAGVALYIVPTANLGWAPVPARCLNEERAALERRMQGSSPARVRATLAAQHGYLVWQQYEARHPEQVCLGELDGSRGGFGIACGWGVGEIEQGMAGLGQSDSPGPSLFHGIVPDGVASVVLELPRHLGTVTAEVHNNIYLAPMARYVQAPARIEWRDAGGRVIRTTGVP